MFIAQDHLIRDDHTIEQNWQNYRPEEHQTWRRLVARQKSLLPGRASLDFFAGLDALSILEGGIPHFERLNEVLGKATGWRIVAVPGLVPDDIFFNHLANRRFPAARFIRTPEQMDYLEEPDVFHDIFGHVPLLMNPVFADYMQAYGEGGLKAIGLGALERLSRLYWYTVEFGLIETLAGLRIYGAGILSSGGEVEFSLDSPSPHRIRFDLKRVLRTEYKIDDFQANYFVIRDYRELFDLAQRDFTLIYQEIENAPTFAAGKTATEDDLLHRGTGEYHS
ncbi:MAG: phenylalanine 4-monooxygenase [Rhodospirillaceae bacterium]|jgi:phenylalanine-4-hydroxylase|nr:phenylalanine 4-monooxygenase [Rhodospirillaceae bacterium]MBT5778005.1 phenylalanine 4-monooxygenase [Rhodospirillaceae bacterium]